MRSNRFSILLFSMLLIGLRAFAEGRTDTPLSVGEPFNLTAPDSVFNPLPAPKPKPHGIVNKIIAYFNETNKPHQAKGLDISFIGGPYYSSDTKFGIGLIAAGLYRTNYQDTITPPSDISLTFKATTTMHFELSLDGAHILPNDKARLHYTVNFASIATKFWGIGYDMNINNANECKFKYLNSTAKVDFVWRLAPNFYIGPLVQFDYVNGRDFKNPALWNDENKRTFNLGAGFTVQYDSRDFLSNAYKGIFFRLDQRFNPRFFLNKYAFSLTELEFDSYHRAWKGAVLAFHFHTRLTYGNTPWGLLGTLGGSDNMRGYFEGRFRDKCEADVCLELRQHVWRRNGVVAWIGAGTVFPRFEALRWRKVLPNYGVGYRWEFKKRVNVRLDIGFGRHQKGLIFSINEAF